MSKRAAFLVFFVSVLALVCANKTNAADPNLVGWWKLDGDVLDGSGNGRNGSLQGDAHFEPGLFDQALALDGTGDYATINGYKGILGGNPFSISAWVKSTSSGNVTMVNWGTQSGGQRVDFRLYQGSLRVEHGNGNLQGNTTVADGEWHHVALTVTANAPISHPQVMLYLDGKDDSQATTDPDTFNIVANIDVTIGRRGTNSDRAFPGLIDDVGIYNRVLTAAEIKDLARRPRSYGPAPADGTFLETPFAVLSWKPGGYAVQYDVYFGTNPTPGPAEYVGRQGTAFYYAPVLQIGATYYWRIDDVEVDDVTIHQGDVWSFTVLSKTASRPNPYDGARYIDPNVTLNWTAGLGAVFHNVYFGVNFEDVNAGTAGTSKGQQPAISYSPGPLALDTVYYWRIDEVQMDMTTVHKGDVWSFKTMPPIAITDPNLVCWWTLDEGQGTIAVDWSGHNNHGTLIGDPQWIAGYAGGALDFDGSGDRVEMTYPGVTGTRSRTVTAWIKTAASGEIVSWGDNVAGQKWIFRIQHVAAGFISGALRVEVNGGNSVGYKDLRDSQWHHVAAVLVDDGSPDALEITLYVDGRLEPTSTEQDEPINTAGNGNVRIGESPWHNRPFTGQIDDVRIYDKALTQSDIKQVIRVDPLLAWDPIPDNAYTPDIDAATPLSWKPGDRAAQHDVYLGTDRTAVDNANTSDTTGVYRGRQNTTSYTPPEALKWGQTYYWRIDEYNTDGTISKGRTWTFSVADYLIPDDFESYTDDVGSRIFQTWKDGFGYTEPPPGYLGNGTGSTVGNAQPPYAEPTIVHSGSQSMRLAYDNSGTGGKARYSETQREWASPKDWTRNGVKALTLYFYGAPANAAEQLYVALEDNAGQVKVVNHPDPEAVQGGTWQEWNIELTQFAGVNLKAIKKMYIGLGSRTSPQLGGTGTIFIDDIRVYPSRCVPSIIKPAADLSGNCVVDQADVDMLANLWLSSGFQITPVDPGTGNLVARYTFDGNTNDSAGTNNGVATGLPTYGAGKFSQAINLDGVDDYVDCGAGASLNIAGPVTISAWIKLSALGLDQKIAGNQDDTTGGYKFGVYSNNVVEFEIRTSANASTLNRSVAGGTALTPGVWYHVVGVYSQGNYIRTYVNGVLDRELTTTSVLGNSTGTLRIGCEPYNPTAGLFNGLIDEVRVYKTALSDAQVAWLAGYTSPFSIPADLRQDGKIDFKDFAVLADSWLEQLFWP